MTEIVGKVKRAPEGRTKVILVLATVAIVGVAVWFVVTQPTLSKPGGASPFPVEPARLQTHVRMLSETFFPRDCTHPGNLDQVAEYIQQEFVRANGAVSEQPYTVPPDFPKTLKDPAMQQIAGKCVHTYRNVIAAFGPDTNIQPLPTSCRPHAVPALDARSLLRIEIDPLVTNLLPLKVE